jgi:hypothetical protein
MSTSRLTSEQRRAWRRRFGAAVVVATGALAAGQAAFGQSVLDFDDWMEKIDRRSQSVQRNLANKNAAAASTDAREIGDLYGSMETYFTRRGNADNAVKLSREGRELAATVVRSAAAKDFATASQAAITLAKACRTCHVEYKPLE